MCHMSPNYLTYTKVILWKCEYSQAIPQGPHSQILMIGVGEWGGGVQQRLIIYTQKYPNFRICLSKKITTFLTYPKISLSPFFTTQKNPSIFHRPKKIHFWPKFQTQKNHLDPPVIKICEWGPWEPYRLYMLCKKLQILTKIKTIINNMDRF